MLARTWSPRVNRLVERVCVALLVMLVLDVWLGVLVRYVIPPPLTFTEELARYLMIWMTLLAVSSGVAHREHIGVVLVFSRFPTAVRRRPGPQRSRRERHLLGRRHGGALSAGRRVRHPLRLPEHRRRQPRDRRGQRVRSTPVCRRDGQMNPAPIIAFAKFDEVQDHLSVTNHIMTP